MNTYDTILKEAEQNLRQTAREEKGWTERMKLVASVFGARHEWTRADIVQVCEEEFKN